VNIRSRIIPTLALVKIPTPNNSNSGVGKPTPRIILTLALVKIRSYKKNQYIFFPIPDPDISE
jgi:hypothetical protein